MSGRTVLITGAGSGIGRLLAEGAAARGARVVIWDLSPASGAEVCEAIRARGGEALSFAVDVTDREAVAAAADQTGPVDVLVNNAGIVTGKRLLDAADEEIERTFAVNTLALYWVTRAFLPGMIARRSGLVVTIASAAGLVGVAKQTDYSASKFAAVGFAESLRVELAKDDTGVDSFVVCPYYIDTGMFAGAKTKFPRLLPILSPDYAAGRTLDAIESGRIQLIMPRFVRTLPLVRMLPAGWFDQIMNVLGVNNTMDAFTGRSQPAEPRAATAGRQA
ncbi:SDR family oxidoreductase [Brevibacterium luteolum]|uniref:SDR family oxidoreductase n=1 Tax=Brevibacterium luteolum TaxID=199591 RepID=UPI0035CD3B52